MRAARSNGGGTCVELTPVNVVIAMRDSKNTAWPVLGYTTAEWRAFPKSMKNGDCDNAF